MSLHQGFSPATGAIMRPQTALFNVRLDGFTAYPTAQAIFIDACGGRMNSHPLQLVFLSF
jgi:hypothetical protein